VIIVNWNSKGFLRKCLASLFANEWDPAWEVVIIDNASYDGSGEMVAANFPGVRFLQSKHNLGFAGANNLAFSQCSGHYILFLNPDTEIVGAALRTMLSFLKVKSESAGAVGVRLLNTDLTLQTSCILRFPTIINQALDLDLLRRVFPRASIWGVAPLFGPESTVAAVEAISGACLMVTREGFEQVGRFTASYFMYSEDVDLCYKLQASGRRNYYLGGAAVIHHGGKSTANHETRFSAVVMHESRHQFLRRHHGNFYAAAYRLSTGVTAAARLSMLAVVYGVFLGRFRRAYLCAALLRWYRVLRWSLGLEAWSRNLQRLSNSCSEDIGPHLIAPSPEPVASNVGAHS
jgi:GT2 family glycosyltransferase